MAHIGFVWTPPRLRKAKVRVKAAKANRRKIPKAAAKAKAKGRPVVVVVHYPLFLQKPDEKEAYFNLPVAKRMELLKLCEENGVVAFLAGHTHKLIVNDYKGIQLVNGETTSKNFDNRPMGFRWWDVGSDRKMKHHFLTPAHPSPRCHAHR